MKLQQSKIRGGNAYLCVQQRCTTTAAYNYLVFYTRWERRGGGGGGKEERFLNGVATNGGALISRIRLAMHAYLRMYSACNSALGIK